MRKLSILAAAIVLIGLFHFQGVSAATIRWVNGSANNFAPPGNNCNNPGYATIQAAVNAAAPADVVNVCPGTYSENVVIPKSLTVKSTGGAAVTTVNAAISAHVFDIVAANVSLEGFTIVPVGVADGDIGVHVAVDGITNASITQNTIIGGRIGVNLGCGSDTNVVAFNVVSNQPEAGINIDTCEIAPFPGSDNNQVHHNTACSNTSTGSIALGGSVTGNDVHHNTATKISVFGTGNEIHHNTTQVAIVDNNAPNNSLHDNTVDPTVCVPPPPATRTLVWECFELQDGDSPNAPLRLLTRNFGWDSVSALRAVRMCEPALKTRGQGTPPGSATVLPNALMNLQVVDPRGTVHTFMLAGSVALGGPDTAPADVLDLDLQSTAAVGPSAGAPNALLDSFFDVFVELSAGDHSTGRIGSFFDIFTEITLDRQDGRGTLTVAPDRALHFGTANAQGEMSLEGSYRLAGPGGDSGFSITGGTFTPNPPYTRVVECYRAARGADPNNPYQLETRNFGPDAVVVRLSTSFCEGAIKSAEPAPANILPPPLVWQCFNVAGGEAPLAPVSLQTRNFGIEQVQVRKLVTLCEDARKVRPTAAGGLQSVGEPTGRVYACYQIAGKDALAKYVLTTRNFGADSVLVRRSNLLCEPAKKTPLYDNLGGEDNVPAVESSDR